MDIKSSLDKIYKKNAVITQVVVTALCLVILVYGIVSGINRVAIYGIVGLLFKDIVFYFFPQRNMLYSLSFGSHFNRCHRYVVYAECISLVFLIVILVKLK